MLSCPQILVPSVKRFKHNFQTQTTEKLFTIIKTPLLLKTTQISIIDTTYILYGILLHGGLEAERGHYISVIRCLSDAVHAYTIKQYNYGTWIQCDDSIKQQINWSRISAWLTRQEWLPYQFFYLRVDQQVNKNNQQSQPSPSVTKSTRTV